MATAETEKISADYPLNMATAETEKTSANNPLNMVTVETEKTSADYPVIEITEEQNFVEDGGCGDTNIDTFHSESFIKQHVVPMKVMRQDISHSNYRKSVLAYPVTLADLQDPALAKHLEESQQFKIIFTDRLTEHNTTGFVSLRYRTSAEADKAGESLKKWKDDLTIRTKLSNDCGYKALSELRGKEPARETEYMVFVRFLPEGATEEALDELIPGSISVDIATNFKGENRNYAYLTYKSQEAAKQAAETHRDVEMGGKKLLVVHYGTYVELPVRGEGKTETLSDDKRAELLQQYRDMKTTFNEKCSLPNVTKNEKKHLRNRLDTLRARIMKDTRLRVKEKKSVEDIKNTPGLNGEPPDIINADNSSNSLGNNESNKQGNNQGKSKSTGDNQESNVGETKDNTTNDTKPLTKRQQRRQKKRKQPGTATEQTQREPSQQQGDMCPSANGMSDVAMTNFLPTMTATAMNMLVGFLSSQMGQQMPQLQQQLPQLQQQQQQQQQFLQQSQKKQQKQRSQQQQQLPQQFQQQQQQFQQQQQQQQQPQGQQKSMTAQELKKQERRRLQLQKRRQSQKLKRNEKKLQQQGMGGALSVPPSTSTSTGTGGANPSHNHDEAQNNMNLYGTSGYYDNQPRDPGFHANNSGSFLDDNHAGTSGFHSNTQWQQGSDMMGGYNSFVSGGTVGSGNYGNSTAQESSYNLGTGYNLSVTGGLPGNSFHDEFGMDSDHGNQGGWKRKSGRGKGNNKRKRIN